MMWHAMQPWCCVHTDAIGHLYDDDVGGVMDVLMCQLHAAVSANNVWMERCLAWMLVCAAFSANMLQWPCAEN